MKKILVSCFLFLSIGAQAQGVWKGKFEQMGTDLPTPNTYRTASGAPGAEYWQQKVDYKIKVALGDADQTITGEESIKYHNNSPDVLDYLWVQLDQNIRKKESIASKVDSDNSALRRISQMPDSLSALGLSSVARHYDFDAGFKIGSVTTATGESLDYIINGTMMRVDLKTPLKSGGEFDFNITWSFKLQDRMNRSRRSGFEYFPEDDNYLYTIAQFYPRLAVYNNVEGWQNKQFIGQGEFTLEFGDFDVEITVPSDFVVASTGTLQNETEILTKKQLDRLAKARKSFDKPVFVITEEEAVANEKAPDAKDTKTWKFTADNVRDFGFATSKKFMWDAQAVKLSTTTPLAMSFYPKEGNPLWEKESTKAIVNTLKTYSKYTFDYPYPVAISVHSASIGMEYPMICFNWGRPDKDGKYTDAKKWRTIMVIVHEIGHNYFPMIVNSDERQWTWMDEGLNSFLESVTERECYPDMPIRRGPAKTIVKYMKGDKQLIRPIMTNSEQVLQLGNNAYGKPAAALDVLRETVMGRELFDYAFKEYANRWAFKNPTPADFFRTMEDASAVDLDWFWRGWFYSTDHVDVSVESVKWFKIGIPQPQPLENKPKKSKKKRVDTVKQSADEIPNEPKFFSIVDTPEKFYGEFMNRLDDKALMQAYENKNFYEVTFKNLGGLVMPIIVKWSYEDGTTEVEKLPVEAWKSNEEMFTKIFIKDKKVVGVELDPEEETADVERENNYFPRSNAELEFDKAKEEAN